jgi:hypothetical protein
MTTSYNLPDPDPTSQLVEPSHADLHTATNHAVQDITNRIVALETAVTTTTAPGGSIEQARLATSTWTIFGALVPENVNLILSPVIWNITDRPSAFSAAKAAVMLPPNGSDILIDIVTSPLLDGNAYDYVQAQTSILLQRLVIPAGQTTSVTLGPSNFVGEHIRDTWVGAAVTQIGSTDPGYDLTIQLNRLL